MRYISEEEADFMLETVCHIDDLSNLNSPTVQEAKKNPSKYCLKVQNQIATFAHYNFRFYAKVVP